MKKYLISILLIFAFIQLGLSLSCGCSKIQNRFISGIHNSTLTFLGEVIQHDSIKSFGTGNKITILKVLKKYHGYGAFEPDTVKVFNGNGMDYCINSLRDDSIGAKFILTGYFREYENFDLKTYKEYSIGKFLTLPICSVPILKVENDSVKGNITRGGKYFFKNENRREKIHEWIWDKLGGKLADWYERNFLKTNFYKPPQIMTLEKVERIIKNKIRQL